MLTPGSAIPEGPDDVRAGAGEVPDAAGGRPGSGPAQVTAGLPAGMIAVRSADVARPGGTAGAGALLAAPAWAGAVALGEVLGLSCAVRVAPAVVSRGGVVRARGWLPDHVRLGELERHLGGRVIEDLVEAAVAGGRMPAPQRMRLMSLALTIRMMVAMTLMPEASYTETIRRLAGHLDDVRLDRDWHVRASGVVTGWRGKVPPAVMEELFWQAAGPLAGGGADDDDGGPVLVLGGMPVCGIDGMLVNLADTPANRAMFGCTGTRSQKGLGSAPFPQLLAVVITARAGRAKLGAITGKARAGEQTLLARLIRRRPDLFAGRVTVFDRNFPGHKIITPILYSGGHVVAPTKSGLALPAAPGGGGWLPHRAPPSLLNAPRRKMSAPVPVPAAPTHAGPPRAHAPETSEHPPPP